MTDAIDLDSALDEMGAMVLSFLPPDLMDLSDIDVARARLDGLLGAMPAPPMPDDVAVTEAVAPSIDGGPDVRVKVYAPTDRDSSCGAILWIHGGGMVMMSADGDDFEAASFASAHRCIVASVDYRLAPEASAPGLVDDCFAALTWLANQASEMGIDATRIMIGGASAGAGLAAGTALRARDAGGPALVGQMLRYPMLDHRNETPSSHAIHDLRVWNRSANIAAWEAYLGGAEPTAYSSPSLATDLSALPPAHINVGTFDMFHDEDVAYAAALNRAGVPCELHVYPGAFHASNGFMPDHPTSVRWAADEAAFIDRCLAVSS
ncbi:MAG: acetyl esterase/lipase [Ilumatobacter sp.]|jgi:acetyl esterase/lipase